MARTTRRRVTATATAPGEGTSEAPRRVREKPARPASAPLSTVARRMPVQRKRRNPLAVLGRFEPRFVADILSETRKVTWPSFEETRYLTVVVAIVATVVGLVLGGIDLAFGWIIQKLFF
jgi:preprotein translocase subunit SecE